MSEEAPKTPVQEPEAIPGLMTLGTLVGVLVVFGASAVIVFFLFRAWISGRQGYRDAEIPAEVHQRTVAEVEQLPFEAADHAKKERARELTRLSAYGWVDRQKGLAHEPIDVAIDALVREEGRR